MHTYKDAYICVHKRNRYNYHVVVPIYFVLKPYIHAYIHAYIHTYIHVSQAWLWPFEVVCTLVALLFSIPGLKWSDPWDHVELFAGQAEVTLGEIQASGSSLQPRLFLIIKMGWPKIDKHIPKKRWFPYRPAEKLWALTSKSVALPWTCRLTWDFHMPCTIVPTWNRALVHLRHRCVGHLFLCYQVAKQQRFQVIYFSCINQACLHPIIR